MNLPLEICRPSRQIVSYIVLGIQEREEETVCLVNYVICEEQRFGRIIVI